MISKLFKPKVSKYNVLVEIEGGTVLYNQISGGLLLLDELKLSQYRLIESRQLKGVDKKFLKLLFDGMYVVAWNFDEVAWMHSVFLKKSRSHLNKGITIAPTDRCNLDCDYCYEAKDQWVLMSDETIEQTKKFIDVFVSSTPTNTFNITWFGGEPTLHMKAIGEISSHVTALSQKMNFSFGQNMITNGTTLDSKMRSRLAQLDIKKLQITVDGLKEDHDKKRPFRKSMSIKDNRLSVIQSGGGCGGCGSEQKSHNKSSFEKIMVNLPSLHEEGFLVSVRVNLNEDNFQSFEKLKNQLSVYSGINVYPARITGPHVGNISKEKFSCIEESAISSFTGTSCMASQAYNLGISQNGMISKCWEHITNENNVVGHVSNLEMAKTGFIDDYSPAKDPDCSQCHVLPTCWGGCRAYNKFFERGYISKNYDGCSYAKWNIREKVLNLYQNAVRKKV